MTLLIFGYDDDDDETCMKYLNGARHLTWDQNIIT